MTLDAVNDLLNNDKPEPVISNGQYIIPRGGERFTRCTTYASTLDDRFSLERWQQRMVADGLILRPDLRAKFAAIDPDEKQQRNDVCEEAIEAAKGKAGANVGTALHAFAEKVDRGEDIFIPEPWDADIKAYSETLEANGVRVNPDLMENIVVCRDLHVAGRYDRIVTIDGFPQPLIADLKGLALTTQLPTPSGWTTMGAVEVGDSVIDAHGQPCTIIAKSAVKQIGTYIVRFDDGSQIVCDSEHIWWTQMAGVSKPRVEARPIADIIATLRHRSSGQARHTVPVAGPLDLPDADLLIDPYLLGCWLGDGNRGRGQITKGRDLFAILDHDGHALGVEQADKRTDACLTRTVLGLITKLRSLDLIRNKHIPDIYMRASIDQRLRLLQGLMDTDGTWNTARRTAVFSSTDKSLALQVQELILSLGQRAHFATYDRHGFGLTVESYTIEFTPAGMNPFRLPRKAEQAEASTKTTTHARRRVIVSIEPGPDVPTACIAVDSPTRTYLCGESMIPTHNTGSIEHSLTTIAIQLAIYANADEIYDPDTDTLSPMPRVDEQRALIIHLPAGEATCRLYLVDIAKGWQAAQLCRHARAWRSEKGLAEPFESTATARAKWLADRAAALKAEHPDAFAELAARWPAGVPTFKQGGHSDDDLLLLSMLVSDVEARHSVSFGDADPAHRRASAPVVEALIDRHGALPSDLAALVEKRGSEAGIPPIRSRRFLAGHVDQVEEILGEIEAMHEARRAEVRALLEPITEDDADLIAAVAGCCGLAGEWTRKQIDVLHAVETAMSNLVLGFSETDDRITVVAINGEERLVERYGSKSAALSACKQIAETWGLAKPRSVTDAAGNPALVALAMSAATNEETEHAA